MTFFAPDLVETLGWTLLHSLWQGLLIFVLVVPALVYFKKHSPQLRYNLLCLALSILVGMMAFTFFAYLPEGGDQLVIHRTDFSDITTTNTTAEVSKEAPAVIMQANFISSINHFISLYSSQLVSIWLIGVLFFAFRWVGGIFYTYRLKSISAQSAPDDLQQQMKQWSKKLGIRKSIKLLESAAIEVPIIIGHLKPVILLPIGTVSGLLPHQLEAIIVHELAHIRRNDFLVNLLLSGLEMILFYHPVFWWLSSKIHEERELCCDDIAVAACGNPKGYAQTLLLMEEKRQQNSLAMAYQGKKHHLLHRIKRICLASPASYRPEFGKAGLSLCFLFLLAAVSWAKMPTEPLPGLAASGLETSEAIEAKAPLFEHPTLESREQFAVSDNVKEENSSEVVQPEANPNELNRSNLEAAKEVDELPQSSIAETVFTSYAPGWSFDTIPYVPVIPEMRQQPKLPAIPNFPYTTEQLAKELSEHANDRSFLRNTISKYQGSIDQWHASVKADYLGPWGDWQRAVKDAYHTWKINLKQLSKGDDIAYAVALKKGTKYFEKALREEEGAIRDSEKIIREELEDYIRSFEGTIRNHEKQQKDHDERMAMHDDRMKIHDLRMSVHDGRMNIHDERMSLHDTRMSFHDSRMEAHDIIMEAFEKEFFAALEADGLSKKGTKKLSFIVEQGQVEVNGKMLSDQMAQKYLNMLTKYGFELPANANAKFVVKIDGNSKSFGTTYNYNSEK